MSWAHKGDLRAHLPLGVRPFFKERRNEASELFPSFSPHLVNRKVAQAVEK